MESEEEDGEGDPGVSLYVTGMEGTLERRLVDLCVEVHELVREERLSVQLKTFHEVCAGVTFNSSKQMMTLF